MEINSSGSMILYLQLKIISPPRPPRKVSVCNQFGYYGTGDATCRAYTDATSHIYVYIKTEQLHNNIGDTFHINYTCEIYRRHLAQRQASTSPTERHPMFSTGMSSSMIPASLQRARHLEGLNSQSPAFSERVQLSQDVLQLHVERSSEHYTTGHRSRDSKPQHNKGLQGPNPGV